MLVFRNKETGEEYNILIADAFVSLGSTYSGNYLTSNDPPKLFKFVEKLSRALKTFITDQENIPYDLYKISFPSFLMINSFGTFVNPESRLIDLYLISPIVLESKSAPDSGLNRISSESRNKQLIDTWLNNKSYSPILDALYPLSEESQQDIILKELQTGNHVGFIIHENLVNKLSPLIKVLSKTKLPIFVLTTDVNNIQSISSWNIQVPIVLVPTKPNFSVVELLQLISEHADLYTVLPTYNYSLFLHVMSAIDLMDDSHQKKLLSKLLFSTYFPYSRASDVTSSLLYLLARFFKTPVLLDILYRNLMDVIGYFNYYNGRNPKSAKLVYKDSNMLFAKHTIFNFMMPFVLSPDVAAIKTIRFQISDSSSSIQKIYLTLSSPRFNLLPLVVDIHEPSLTVISSQTAGRLHASRSKFSSVLNEIKAIEVSTPHGLVKSLTNFLRYMNVTNKKPFLEKILFRIKYGFVPPDGIYMTRADMTLFKLKNDDIIKIISNIENSEAKSHVYSHVKETTLISNNNLLVSPELASFLNLQQDSWVIVEPCKKKIVPVEQITFDVEEVSKSIDIVELEHRLESFLKKMDKLLLYKNQSVIYTYNKLPIKLNISSLSPHEPDAIYKLSSDRAFTISLNIKGKKKHLLILAFDTSKNGNLNDINAGFLSDLEKEIHLSQNKISRYTILNIVFALFTQIFLRENLSVEQLYAFTVGSTEHQFTFKKQDMGTNQILFLKSRNELYTALKLIQNYLGMIKNALKEELNIDLLFSLIDRALLNVHTSDIYPVIFIFTTLSKDLLSELIAKADDLSKRINCTINILVFNGELENKSYRISKHINVLYVSSLDLVLIKQWLSEVLK